MNFKQGDWITQVKENYSNYPIHLQIKGIVDSATYIVEPNIFDIDAIQNNYDQFELWNPHLNEWCWILDSTLPFPHLQQILRIEEYDNCFVYATAYHGTLLISDIAPFVGELPIIPNSKSL